MQVNVDNKLLQDRITQIRKFRRQHDELKNVIAQVLPSTQYGKAPTGNEINAVKEINEAFLQVKEIDVLVISKGLISLPLFHLYISCFNYSIVEGAEIWENAVKRYDSRIERVEAQITSKLRDRLATAKNANEMFRVFSKFNALFFRPRVCIFLFASLSLFLLVSLSSQNAY